jgi:hypothetical protein
MLDIRRVEPVGDEVYNIDEVHAFLFNTPIRAESFLFKKLKNLLDKKQNRRHSQAFGASQIRSPSRAFGLSQIRSHSRAFEVSEIRSHSQAFGVSQLRNISWYFPGSQAFSVLSSTPTSTRPVVRFLQTEPWL